MQEKWIEIKILSDPKHLEQISSYLFALGCDGITEADEDFTVYFPRQVWSAESFKLLKSICYSVDAESEIALSELEAENWNENWKVNFKPFYLTESCVIVPDWEENFDAGTAHKIVISPKMAFGTGHHETTQLILMLLSDYLKQGAHVLDAGTGSAILAVHAVQLGAKNVLAFDNDPVAMENAEENVALNGFENQIDCHTGQLDIANGKEFDLILANINRNVLLGLAAEFIQYLLPQGILILSGLLETDFEMVSAAYKQAGFELIERKQRGEWLALVCKKQKTT